jgi:copper chaperone CopZ
MCAAGLQNKLRELPGVANAEVSYQEETATIEYDPGLVDPVRLADMVERSGFAVARRGPGRRAGKARPPSSR